MNHHKTTMIFIALVTCAVIGCSGATTTTIAPTVTSNVTYVPADNTVMLTGIRKVAIFPFADYSHQQDMMPVNEWGGNIKILEEITDQFTKHGLTVAVQEDVNTILVDENIIRPIADEKYLAYGTNEDEAKEKDSIITPEYELNNEVHSPDMQNEIIQIIDLKGNTKKQVSYTPVLQGATVGLTREKIVDIGDKLGVDVIIRGRIIDFGYKDIGTVNPLYRGVVSTVLDSVKDIMYGATNAYGYENDLEKVENMALGGAIGYGIGNAIPTNNELAGTAIGVASGWMASQHPKKAKRSAVIQVRVYAQNALTGDVLWSNRAEIEYTPKSNYAYNETHPKTMFDNAIKAGISQLMDDFFKQGDVEPVASPQPILDNATVTMDAKPGI